MNPDNQLFRFLAIYYTTNPQKETYSLSLLLDYSASVVNYLEEEVDTIEN